MKKIPKNVEEYLDTLPEEQLPYVLQMRAIIRAAAPHAQEVISYGMPAFKQNKVLVYFAAAKHHVGFYPTSAPMEVFAKELEPFETSKGAVRFPYGRKLPAALIKKIVKYRIQQDAQSLKKK